MHEKYNLIKQATPKDHNILLIMVILRYFIYFCRLDLHCFLLRKYPGPCMDLFQQPHMDLSEEKRKNIRNIKICEKPTSCGVYTFWTSR